MLDHEGRLGHRLLGHPGDRQRPIHGGLRLCELQRDGQPVQPRRRGRLAGRASESPSSSTAARKPTSTGRVAGAARLLRPPVARFPAQAAKTGLRARGCLSLGVRMPRPVVSTSSPTSFELEAQMTRPAAQAAKRWWGRGKLDVVAHEVVAPGAIADIVGCAFDAAKLNRRLDHEYEPILEWAPLACVSACARGAATTSELSSLTGLSVSAVRKATALAVAHGALERNGRVLQRKRQWSSPVRRMVAVELKLSDWRKALYQAMSYSHWADEAWVVMGRSVSADLRDAAVNAGVGVALLDGEAMIVVAKPTRRRHGDFDVSRLLAGEQALAQSRATRQATPTARDAWLSPLASTG
jgi:hypothetical protein